MIEMRALGRSGVEVPSLCLGTMTFGEQNTEAESHRLMDVAVDRGVTFFDTAELYPVPPKAETQGRTERHIGSWLRARGNRERLFLATKVVGRGPMTWFRDSGAPSELSRAQMTEALEKSLGRLGVDHIDLYQLHFPDRPMPWGSNPTAWKPATGPEHPIEDILDTLDGFVRAGKVRFIGLSNESAWGTMRFVQLAAERNQARVQSVQNAYSLLNRTFEVALAEVAARESTGLLAYSALAQGYLTGKYRNGALPQGSRKQLFDRLQRYEKPGAAEAVEAYWALAQELGLDLAQLALRFAATRPFTTSVILGATTVEQLETDIGSLDLAWTGEIEAAVDRIHQLHSNPCP